MNRREWLKLGRSIFLAVTLCFGWWSLHSQLLEIFAAMERVGVLAWISSVALVLLGLTATGFVWALLLKAYGHTVTLRQSLSVFFVGQLGKYIPGSVWSFGAQAQMTLRFNVPIRTSVATGLISLGWNVATAALVGSIAVLSGSLDLTIPLWISLFGIILIPFTLTPRIVNWLGSRLAGPGRCLHLRLSDCGTLLILTGIAWTLYGLALMVLDPTDGRELFCLSPVAATGAFAISYIVGVLVVFAPAGFGAREATLILVLSHDVGVTSAAAIALLARVVHTLCDFIIAGLSWGFVKLKNSESSQSSL